jgi:hypothetical protein
MTFPLPRADSYKALRAELVANFQSKSGNVESRREIEVTRNFALGEKIELLKSSTYSAKNPGDPGADPAGREVLLRADADQKGLYLTYDCKNVEFVRGADAVASSAMIDLFIDGRPMSERRQFGFTEALNIYVPYVDGPCTLKDWSVGQLGEGYDRPLDWKYINASVVTRGGGDRRITVFIPRSFFYRHEWNLRSTDSMLGIGTSIAFLRVTPERPKGSFPDNARFRLNKPGMHPCNTDSLPALELAPQASGRWSVRIY